MPKGGEKAPAESPERVHRLYDEYGVWLRTVLVSRYGRQGVDDLAQETWLRFIPYQSSKVISHPKALLLRIAANLAADRSSRRQKRSRLGLEVTNLEGLAVHEPTQTEALAAKQLVLGLPQPLRDVFVLSRVGGLSNSQIAEQLGLSPKTVEWRMTKALAHCAAQLRR